MIVEIQKAFSHIEFFDDGHFYINTNTGERLPSVTGHIVQFQPKFNEKYWLKEKAKQRGISQDELKKEWVWASKIGAEMGSALHSFLEQKVQRRHIVPQLPDYLDKDKFKILIKQAEEFVKTIEYPIIACEFVMCNKEDNLAGMCDLILLGETGLRIIDYKTGQMKDSYGKFHSKPYKYIDASSLGKYSLQLNHYKKFLEDSGFPVESLEIVWFNENNPTFEIFKIPKIEILND